MDSQNKEIDSTRLSYSDVILNDENSNLLFEDRIDNANSWLRDMELNGISLKRRILETGSKEVVRIADRKKNEILEFINLGSNDYLNLTHHPAIISAVKEALDLFGCGAGSAPHALGTSKLHDQLEKKIAQFKGCEAAIVQSSGFIANYGVVNTLMKKKDLVIFDQFAHASLFEGANLYNTNILYFKHNDVDSLEYILKKAKKEYLNRLVVVDGIYSMDGDIAPLDKIIELTKKYDAWLLVDEAHATGIVGKNGKGTVDFFNLEGEIDIVTGTFSKAIGSVGGFVAGSKKFINYMLLSNKTVVFSTSAFTPAIAASLKAIEIIENDSSILEQLNRNTKKIKEGLVDMGFDIGNSVSPIIPVMINDEKKALYFGEKLKENGIVTLVGIFPAVPRGFERIRLSVTAGMTTEQIEYILEVFKKLKRTL